MLQKYIPEFLNLVVRVDSKPAEAGYALSILANFFKSAELDLQNFLDGYAPFPKIIPSVMNFIKNSKRVVEAVEVLYGIRFIAGCLTPLPNLIPYLATIFSHVRETNYDIPAINSTISLLFVVSQIPNNTALMDDSVVAFLQYVRSGAIYVPIMDDLLKKLTSQPDKRIENIEQPFLTNFLQKNGIPTSRYIPALAEGRAAHSSIRFLEQHFDSTTLDALCKISFFSAKEIVEEGGIRCLLKLANVAHPLKVMAVFWMISLRKRSKKLISESDCNEMRNFVNGVCISQENKQDQNLKSAILFNLAYSGTFLSLFLSTPN
jgi:hypothetical protein